MAIQYALKNTVLHAIPKILKRFGQLGSPSGIRYVVGNNVTRMGDPTASPLINRRFTGLEFFREPIAGLSQDKKFLWIWRVA